ncbi:MAG: lipoyl(octanoyl) transferase [Candidatus Marinimicrobia bacterium]|nr:lipoyl(octanoyl) transferase [Candidatus Neomarinimicrobiota bacterium]
MNNQLILNSVVDLSSKFISNLDILDYLNGNSNNDEINFYYLGKVEYSSAWNLQKKIHDLVKSDELGDIVLFLEHNHVYTLGKNADSNYILDRYQDKIDIIQTDRGGQVTYHGPGQLIGYPIINLNKYRKSVSWYMRTLEKIIIKTLEKYAINATTKENLTGVWVNDEKICAMGVRLSKWVTMHGFALNLNPDMKYYDGMIPCGIQEYGITSLFEFLNKEIDTFEVMNYLANFFINETKIIN